MFWDVLGYFRMHSDVFLTFATDYSRYKLLKRSVSMEGLIIEELVDRVCILTAESLMLTGY